MLSPYPGNVTCPYPGNVTYHQAGRYANPFAPLVFVAISLARKLTALPAGLLHAKPFAPLLPPHSRQRLCCLRSQRPHL